MGCRGSVLASEYSEDQPNASHHGGDEVMDTCARSAL